MASNGQVNIDLLINASNAAKNLGEIKNTADALTEALQDVEVGSEAFNRLSQAAQRANSRVADIERSFEAIDPIKKAESFLLLGEGIVGGFTAAQGALAVFGSENKKLEETLVKVQGAVAIAQGARALTEGILNAEIARGVILSKASAIQTAILAAAQGALGITVNTTSLSFKVLRGALIATGVGALIVGLSLLVSNFDTVKKAILGAIDKFVFLKIAVAPLVGLFNLVRSGLEAIGIIDDAKTSKIKENSKKAGDAIDRLITKNGQELEVLEAKGASERELAAVRSKANAANIIALDNVIKLNRAELNLIKDKKSERYKELVEAINDNTQKVKVIKAEEIKNVSDLKELKEKEVKDAKEKQQKIIDDRKAASDKIIENQNKLKDALSKINADITVLRQDAANTEIELTKQIYTEYTGQIEASALANAVAIQKQVNDTNKAIAETKQRGADIVKEIDQAIKDQRDFKLGDKVFKAGDLVAKKGEITSEIDTLLAQLNRDVDKLQADKSKAIIIAPQIAISEGEVEALTNDLSRLNDQFAKSIDDNGYNEIAFSIEEIESGSIKAADVLARLNKTLSDATPEQRVKAVANAAESARKNVVSTAAKQQAELQKLIELEQQLNGTDSLQKIKDLQAKKVELAKSASDQIVDITAQEEQKKKELTEKGEAERAELIKQGVQGFADSIGQVFNILSTSRQTEDNENEKAQQRRYKDIENRLKKGVINEEKANELKAQSDEVYNSKKEELQRKAAKQGIDLQIIQTLASVAQAVVVAMTAGPLIGQILAGITAGLGAIQVGVLIDQRSKLANGGLLRGRSHRDGGIPVGATGIEVEGGEYVVNKRSTAKYLPMIEAINADQFGTMAPKNGKFGNGGRLVQNAQEQTSGSTIDQPIRAYVVENEISNAQIRRAVIARKARY